MKSLLEIQTAISRLSSDELREVIQWMENRSEDRAEMTDVFKARIERSERDRVEGRRSRTR